MEETQAKMEAGAVPMRFEDVYLAYYKGIYNYIFGCLRHRESAEDVTAEVFANGTFHFTAAFGIAKDPGCAIPYKQVDKNIYWSGDARPGMKYNQMVDIRELPDLDVEESEHIIDYDPHYTYAMNISYNEEGVPGLGSAFFIHCFGTAKPYTGGCVAIPVADMRFVMQKVRPDCVVIMDFLKNLSPETAEKWKI